MDALKAAKAWTPAQRGAVQLELHVKRLENGSPFPSKPASWKIVGHASYVAQVFSGEVDLSGPGKVARRRKSPLNRRYGYIKSF